MPLLCALSLLSLSSLQAHEAPAALAYAPVDAAYRGTIKLEVDATDLAQRVFRVRETIPVQAGPLTLLFPQWLPGNHRRCGPIDKVAGLMITANGQRWRGSAIRSTCMRSSSTCPQA